TPILPQQVLIALGFGFFFYLISKHWQWIKNLKKSDLVIGIALWLLASFLWLNEPLRDWSYFTAEPTPPNFEIYPYSDAGLYDTFAQNYLIGTSIQYGLTHRPGYAIFLAFLHSIVGQNYDAVTLVQILILAIGPTALYFLASQLGGRPAGIIAALILIFREENAIALTNIIEVSHSKLFMSDVPTMMLNIIFVYFLIHWLYKSENKLYLGVIAGAFLGFSALIRSQALIVIPIVFLCILIAKRKSLKPAFIQSAMFLLGVLVVVLPWMLRNYQISGRMVIEYQNAYTTVIASGYTDNPADIEKLPGETVSQYDDRMFSMILNYIFENPFEVARFYTAYFVHNEISSVVYLPMSLNFFDARSYVRELNMWGWNPPFANPAPQILPLFFITLGLIALGIGIAYQRAKWIGLLPLFIHLGYSLSVVPFKTSGWRFILPVDWILALYFSIGLMHLTLMLFSLFNHIPKDIEIKNTTPMQLDYQKSIPVLSIFLIIGLAFPLIEKSIPKKYPELTSTELVQTYFANDVVLENGESITASALEMFLEAEPSSTVLYGRALYPSFYQSGEYWGDDDSYPLEMRNISRLQFTIIGPMQRRVYIPLPEAPLSFPHTSDVVVIGCVTNAGIQALIVTVDETIVINNLPWRGLSCTLP
ncbi:MAG: glycosyltransferase family 39 protein, partial [Anaerolineales bacterium]|nr:glycosyltransferase family 39 protein [Anaerolineales bacterium]